LGEPVSSNLRRNAMTAERTGWLRDGMVPAWPTLEASPAVLARAGKTAEGGATATRTLAELEERLKALRSAGVTLVFVGYYAGFGARAEKARMERALRVAELAKDQGLKVAAYVQTVGTIFYETFFAEEPRAKDWISTDDYGQHPTYGNQYWRYIPCINSADYLAYIEENVIRAVVEGGVDMIHFDNFSLRYDADSCKCEKCRQAFRQYLKRKYPKEDKRIERFGFSQMDFVEPPHYADSSRYARITELRDPVSQEWEDFRCESITRVLERFSAFARKIDPGIVVETNGDIPCYLKCSGMLKKHCDVSWMESRFYAPRITAEGNLMSHIRYLKMNRTTGNVTLVHADNPLEAAQSLAYNLNCFATIRAWTGPDATMRDYLRFYRENQPYFRDLEMVADVATLRSYRSLTYKRFTPQVSATMAEQTLIQCKVPFAMIFEEDLAHLDDYRVLLLPDVELLSDEAMGGIAAWVRNGGGLVFTGDTGRYDQWMRAREAPAFLDLFGIVRDGAAPQQRVECGSGRVVYMQELTPSLPVERTARVVSEVGVYQMPANWQELMDAVRWAARGSLTVQVDAPLTVTAEFLRQSTTGRYLIHLLNFREGHAAKSIGVTLNTDGKLATVNALSPETGEQEVRLDASGNTFTIPSLDTYLLVVCDTE